MLDIALRRILGLVKSHPEKLPTPTNEAREILNVIKEKVLSTIKSAGREESPEAKEVYEVLITGNYDDEIMTCYYFLREVSRLSREDAVKILTDFFLYEAGLLAEASSMHQILFKQLQDIMEKPFINPNLTSNVYTLSYAEQLGLCFWNGERWALSPLGDMFLTLPSSDLAKRLILILEVTRSVGKGDKWHMPLDFIEQLLQVLTTMERSTFQELSQALEETYGPIWRIWISRLYGLNLISVIGDQIEISSIGHRMLNKVLRFPNDPLYAVAESLSEAGTSAISLTMWIIRRVLEVMKDPLLDKWRQDISEAIENLKERNYKATLRTLLPCIEGIVREIYIMCGLGGANESLRPMIRELRENKWVSERVEGLVKALGRDEVLHGLDRMTREDAGFYAHLAMMAIVELIKDYRRHQNLRIALGAILEQKRDEIPVLKDKSLEDLLRAYPKRRDIIHVQFLNDTKMIITLCRKYCYKVEVSNGSKVKIDTCRH